MRYQALCCCWGGREVSYRLSCFCLHVPSPINAFHYFLSLSKGFKTNECLPWVESKKKKGLSLGSPGMLRGSGILHGVEIHRVGVKVAGGVESIGP